MSRFLISIVALSLLVACNQPAPTASTTNPIKTSAASSGAKSDQDLCYQDSSDEDHDHQRSLDACDRLIATGEYQDFTLAKIYAYRGLELRRLYRHEESLRSFDSAIEIKSDYDYAWRQKSNALTDLYRYEDAVVAAERSVELDPDDSNNVGQLGRALRNSGRYEESRNTLELALALDPENHWIVRQIGWLHQEQDEYKEALVEFRKALALKPSSAWTHYSIGYALEDLGDLEGAIASFDRAIELEPDEASYYNLRGFVRLIENKPTFNVALATEDLIRAARLDPTSPYVKYHLATAFAYTGRGPEAVRELEAAIPLRFYKDKIQRVIRILWDKNLTADAKAASELLKRKDV